MCLPIIILVLGVALFGYGVYEARVHSDNHYRAGIDFIGAITLLMCSIFTLCGVPLLAETSNIYLLTAFNLVTSILFMLFPGWIAVTFVITIPVIAFVESF